MEFKKVIKERYSCRDFLNKEVEQEKINEILEAARLAPTAKNLQPQKIYILKSAEALNKIRQITKSAYNAPIVFMICTDMNEVWKSMYDPNINTCDIDAAIVCTHMALAAKDAGLESCIVKAFSMQEVKKQFNLPENIVPVLLLPVGYKGPKGDPSPRHLESKTIQDISIEL